MSDEFTINRGVSQGDPLSPTAIMEEVFKVHISEGAIVDVEIVTNLKIADDVALFQEKKRKQMEYNPA